MSKGVMGATVESYAAKSQQPANQIKSPIYLTGTSAAALMAMNFPPLKFIVPGFLVEGLTVLAGAPKQGKSYLALDWAIAVAEGGNAFNEIRCEQGDVLYLALEDGRPRLKRRLLQRGQTNGPARLLFMTEWPSMDDGCVEELRAWLEDAPAPRLIVVDTLAKVRGHRARNDTQYDDDYRFVGSLQALAIEYGIAVVLVHHTRKMAADDPFDAISGTRGLTGAADELIVLRREPGSLTATLDGKGRDMEEFTVTLEFLHESGRWRHVGETRMVAKSEERQQILEYLGGSVDPLTPSQIAAGLQKERSNINHLLGRLCIEGKLIKKGRGRYALSTPFQPIHAVHPRHSSYPSSEQSEQGEWNLEGQTR